MSGVLSNFKLDFSITRICLYQLDVNVPRYFSHGTWNSRSHGIIAISSGSVTGYGENKMGINGQAKLAEFAGGFAELEGMPIDKAMRLVRSSMPRWGVAKCEMAETALIDLASKLLRIPALEFLGLTGSEPVPGLFCILDSDLDQVREQARISKLQAFRTHLKVKLFGDIELDSAIVRTVREEMGSSTFLVGDVNGGYRREISDQPVDSIAVSLHRLQVEGLNACEDPAKMTADQWRELQRQVEKLDLLPDYPLRPSYVGLDADLEGTGRIFNIHPGTSGSLFDAIRLAHRIRAMGGKLMIAPPAI